jgi:hypothetical protein
VENSIQKVMQNYGYFLIREKAYPAIVDKWKIRNWLQKIISAYSGKRIPVLTGGPILFWEDYPGAY